MFEIIRNQDAYEWRFGDRVILRHTKEEPFATARKEPMPRSSQSSLSRTVHLILFLPAMALACSANCAFIRGAGTVYVRSRGLNIIIR